ncbi:MAG: hypothetical protein HC902_08280 [Calothrix sp. SM1_5_4]|nr:hypothetical protein [Calothrix sp. SM1_5_4]
MKKTGELLKQKRESSNLSLGEVALATKINPKVLTAIENGDEANLPAKIFLKGFVRSYALYLKADVDEVMRLFAEETGTGTPERVHEINLQPPPSAPTSSRRRSHEESSSGLRTVAVVVIVLLIGLIIGVRELIDKYQKEKVVEAPVDNKVSPIRTEEKPAEVKAVESEVESKTEEKPKESEPEEKADVKAMVGVPPALLAPKVEPKPEIKSEAKPEAKPEPKSEIKSEPTSKPEPAKAGEAKPSEPAKAAAATPVPALKATATEIILEATKPVEVKFQIQGEKKRVSLGPSEIHTIRTDQPLTLDLSDGGAVNIILNGRERGVPGDSGKPKQVTLP